MNNGGAERVMSILVNNFVLNKYEVHLFIYSKENSFYKINPAVTVHHVYSDRNYFNKLGTFVLQYISLIKVKQLIKNNEIECLVSFTTFVNCTTIILSKLTSIPVVISERNDPLNWKPNFLVSLMRKYLYKHANSIVLQTDRSIDSFKTLKVKLPLSKKVIFNPIDPSFSNEKKQKEKIILSVGRLSFEKGHDLLLKAFARSKFEEWKLHFVGNGVEKAKLMKLSKDLNIDGSIVWHGTQNKISEFLNRSPIYILPSRTEGFPNALCEAMACGCAVISFDCPNGPSEIIKDRENGLLVNAEDIEGLADAINTLIEDVNLRGKLGTEACKIVDKLDQNLIFLEWEAHVLDVLKQTQKTR